MPFALPTGAALRALLRLALPVIVVQVGLMAMGVVDTIMVGHLSPEALAAVALGNVYYFGASIFGMGVLMALDPVIAHAAGAGDQDGVARGVQRGLVLAFLLCIPTAFLLAPAPVILSALGQSPEVARLGGAYARACVPGALGYFAFIAIRQCLQALHQVRPLVFAIIIGNIANAVLAWILIFGHLGFPPMGAVGSAWASSAARLLLVPLALAPAWPVLREHLRPLRREALEPGPLGRLLRLGIPIGVQHQLEYGVFAIVALLMGAMGTAEVAGHQVAINLASLTFMVPLGLSSAAAVVVGHAVGRNDGPGTHQAARAALLTAVLFMGTTCILFLALPGPLARLYTNAPEVLAVATVLLPLAGVFQVFDGIQVTCIGILRGLGDTRTPMLTGILGFWFLGLPVSLLLGLRAGLGPAGLWWGLVLGLVVVAVVLLIRLRYRLRQPLTRVQLDAGVSSG